MLFPNYQTQKNKSFAKDFRNNCRPSLKVNALMYLNYLTLKENVLRKSKIKAKEIVICRQVKENGIYTTY